MSLDHLLSTIDAEIARLQQVRALLAGTSTSTHGGKRAAAPKKAGKKRKMSPEGRARIAEAQRKRWAAAKKAGN